MSDSPIRLLIPDLPNADTLLPWLRKIDASRHYTNSGPLAKELTVRIAEFIGLLDTSCVDELRVAVTSSGTSALELALSACNLARGEHALMPALTFPGTANAVLRAGLTPLLTDVDVRSWMLTPDIARKVASKRQIGVVVPVTAFGAPIDSLAWSDFSRESGLPVVVDAAPALGDQTVAGLCHFAFSLHATKALGAGEGGVVISNAPEIIRRVRILADHGFDGEFIHRPGTNAKLSEYHAMVALAQFDRWPHIVSTRGRVEAMYRETLLGLSERVQWQSTTVLQSRTVLTVRLCGRTDVRQIADRLKRDGIETRRWYFPPLHRQPAWKAAPRYSPNHGTELEVTDVLADELLGLPFHPYLRESDVQRVGERLAAALDKKLS